MDSIQSFLSAYMIPIILIFGVILAALMTKNYFELRSHFFYLDSIMNLKNTRTFINKTTGEVEDKSDSEKVTPDTIREQELIFNKVRSEHEVYTQLIPVFPLLGILGTVAGLIGQLVSKDINVMFEALHLAMNSTFWGLIFAIILKILDAVFPARIISETEIKYADYDKKLSNSIRLGNIDG